MKQVARRSLVYLLLISLSLYLLPTTSYGITGDSKLRDTLVFYVGSNIAYVDDRAMMLDSWDDRIQVEQVEGRTLLPVEFVLEQLGGDVRWDEKHKVLFASIGENELQITVELGVITLNERQVRTDTILRMRHKQLLTSLELYTDVLNYLCLEDRGLVIISEPDNVFDALGDQRLVNKYIRSYEGRQAIQTTSIGRLEESVVMVLVEDDTGELFSQGSGFCVAPGLFVTNTHVIKGGKKIILEDYKGNIIDVEGILASASDYDQDLALLKTVTKANLPPLPLESHETLVKGEQIYVIGSPYGYKNSLTEGIVSGVHDDGFRMNVQITAALAPGNSGGPLLNKYGKVVGIASSTIDDGNVNFAISSVHIEEWLDYYKHKAFGQLTTLRQLEKYPQGNAEKEALTKTLLSYTEAYNQRDIPGVANLLELTRAEKIQVYHELEKIFDEKEDIELIINPNITVLEADGQTALATMTAKIINAIDEELTYTEYVYFEKIQEEWKISKFSHEKLYVGDEILEDYIAGLIEEAPEEELPKEESPDKEVVPVPPEGEQEETLDSSKHGNITMNKITEMIPLENGRMIINDVIDNKVLIYDIVDDTTEMTIQLNASPVAMDYNPKTGTLLVTQSKSRQLARINMKTGAVHYIDTSYPLLDVVFTNGAFALAYVENEESFEGIFSVIDVAKGEEVKTIVVDEYMRKVRMIAYDVSSNVLLAGESNSSPSKLHRLTYESDTHSLTYEEGNRNLGGNGKQLAISPDGKHAAFCTGGGNGSGYTLYDINPVELTDFYGEWKIGAYPVSGAFSSENKYFVATDTKAIKVYTVGTHRLIAEYSVEEFDYAHDLALVGISRDSTYVYGVVTPRGEEESVVLYFPFSE